MKFKKFAALTLAYNIAVILWGAFVRATGSGAGCGRHWPLCNGEIIPQVPAVQTAIELVHRTSSGLCLVLVVVLVVWARRIASAGHPIRIAAWTAAAFTASEALLGAGLVLFELVAKNTSAARAVVISLHLVNTFALLAALTLAAWWARISDADAGTAFGAKLRWRRSRTAAALWCGLALLACSAASGAIAALGNTLYPSDSLAQGISWDFSNSAPFLIRLRIWHPVIAASAALLIGVTAWLIRCSAGASSAASDAASDTGGLKRLSELMLGALAVQVVLGVAALTLLAPVALQLLHLLCADIVWISAVVLCESVMRASAHSAGSCVTADGGALAAAP